MGKPRVSTDQHTFQAKLVSFQRGNTFSEELLGVLITRLNSRHVHLFPLDRYIVCLEDGFDRFGDFGSNTIPYIALQTSRKAFLWNIPGISVTVYLPPYFVGLKMSSSTVAMAFHLLAYQTPIDSNNSFLTSNGCIGTRRRRHSTPQNGLIRPGMISNCI